MTEYRFPTLEQIDDVMTLLQREQISVEPPPPRTLEHPEWWIAVLKLARITLVNTPPSQARGEKQP